MSTTNVRLGYACINMAIQQDPSIAKKHRPCVNHSCIAATFAKNGAEYAASLARSNLETVLKVLEWNEEHGIRLYRMSSDMFPHITNPQFIPEGETYSYPLDQFDDLFQKIGEYSRAHGHRLTFHPGQFNQVGSPTASVFEKTARELAYHAEVLDRIGCGPESVMVVHGGGSYGDKEKTKKRWIQQFFKLPKNVQQRLVIENCERQYNWEDMLELSAKIDRPVVFDTHHHNCYSDLVEPQPDPSTFLDKIIKTWTKHGIIPKFHISEQAPDKRVGAHSMYVEEIPDYFWEIIENGQPIDLMIEAKAKEQAVLSLYSEYFDFDDDALEWV